MWRVWALIIEGFAGRSKCGEAPGQLYVVDQIDCEDCHGRHVVRESSIQPLTFREEHRMSISQWGGLHHSRAKRRSFRWSHDVS